MTSLSPPTEDSLIDVTSTRQRCDSAKRVYMRKISYANNVASSPPVPARISSTTFFSSLGSLGSSRTFRSSSICTRVGSIRTISSCAICRISASASETMRRACASWLEASFQSRYLATTSANSLWALAALRYWSASLMMAGSASWRVSSSKRTSVWSSLPRNCMGIYAMTSSPPCDVSSAMAWSRAQMATSVCSLDGGCVVMRCSQRPGAVSSARNEPRRLAAKRISS